MLLYFVNFLCCVCVWLFWPFLDTFDEGRYSLHGSRELRCVLDPPWHIALGVNKGGDFKLSSDNIHT